MKLSRVILFLLVFYWTAVDGAVDVRVKGVGWVADGRISSAIEEVIFGNRDDDDIYLRQFDLEDALLVLNGELNRRGYLHAETEVILSSASGELSRFVWEPDAQQAYTNLDEVNRLELRVKTGRRSFFDEVRISGLQSMEEEEARSFFYPSGYFLVSRADRAFSSQALNSGVANLLARLTQLGRPEAEVVSIEVDREEGGGPVRVHIEIDEGPPYRWERVHYDWQSPGQAVTTVSLPPDHVPDSIYTRDAERDLVVQLRNLFLRAGYPDVMVRQTRSIHRQEDGTRSVELFLRVNPGPRVRLSEMRFEGLRTTRESFARRRAGLEEGAWLDLVEVDDARTRLGRLGVFDQLSVQLYPHNHPEERAAVFSGVEGIRREFNLLAGYGSYEMLRVGAEVRYYNIFGRAHQSTVRVRQSMKSSAGLWTYSVPDLPWILQRGQFRLQGISREELSFRRDEALASVGIEQRYFGDDVSFTTEYRFEILRAVGIESVEVIGDDSANVGSVTFGLAWDRRDRVISPREGFDLRGELELASPFLASDVYYQRLVLGGSLHFMVSNDAIRFHFGFEHGVLARAGAQAEELPFNKRFFPGGENSIRGYQSGGASPRDSSGEFVGAEIYTIGHAEVEFALTQNLSVVVFLDGLHSGRFLEDYPGDTTLWSAGGGLRYSTPLGPIRLEYGHNLNPRDLDPSGTLHFSIGFPF